MGTKGRSVNVRSEFLRQSELHLGPLIPEGVRSQISNADEQAGPGRVLRQRKEETRGRSDSGIDIGGESAVENQEPVEFVIPGAPVGKGRPRFAKRGNFVTTYTPEKTASYENLVKLKAEEAMAGRPVIDGPVQVFVWLWVSPPASWSQKKQRAALEHQTFPTSKPDIDNVIKGIFDAMNEIVWKDDKQVVNLSVFKRYGESARARVTVMAI